MLNAPVPAAKKVLEKAGLTVDDIDLWEINEAFAVVAEKFIRDLKLDRAKVNVNGGAMALGHPIGATGSILIGTMLDELERRNLKRGLITMCAAGGMAPAIIIERVEALERSHPSSASRRRDDFSQTVIRSRVIAADAFRRMAFPFNMPSKRKRSTPPGSSSRDHQSPR